MEPSMNFLPAAIESLLARLSAAREIVVFSGAGLSADSGVPTFRDGATGLWSNVDPLEVERSELYIRRCL